MAATPASSATPYCSATRLLVFHDRQQVADMLRDGDDCRPTCRAILDTATVAGANLARIMLAASGEVDSACLAGERYTPADLLALTYAGEAYREKLTADLAFWRLAQRRQPGSAEPARVPGAQQALAELDRLRDGSRIFAFLETADAGLPSVIEPGPAPGRNTVRKSTRLFGGHGS